MSRTLGMDCIHCKTTPRPGHVEYSMEYHAALIEKVTSAETPSDTATSPAAGTSLPSATTFPPMFRMKCV